MNISLTLKIIVCGLFCVFPVDIKGRKCQCIYGNDGVCGSCDVGCYLLSRQCYECPKNCYSCSSYTTCDVCNAGYYGKRCEHSCNTCRNGLCDSTKCTNGCADGYYDSGGYCRQCIDNCVTCNSNYDCASCIAGRTGYYCQNCKDGYYEIGGHCQQCINNCVTCNSNYDCTSCIAGRTGSYCQNCKDGYYEIGGHCQQCINNCVTCNSNYDCTSCKAGHTGSYCQDCKDGYYRSNGQCIQCNTNCLLGNCYVNDGGCKGGCKNGWSGWTCQNACAPTCYSCERYRNACNSCPFNQYGNLCENACSSNCALNDGVRQCSESNGVCNSGCVDGWIGSQCTEKCEINCISCDAQDKAICHTCAPGFYGQSCENECSFNCVKTVDTRQCSKHDGHCTDGCVEDWTGPMCTEQCLTNCAACDRQNESACTSCKPGHYGPSCNRECSKYCGNTSDASKQCRQDDGTCLDDCVTGYKGDTCNVSCDAGCVSSCGRNTGLCEPCTPTYFGPSCQHLCSTTCYDPGNGSNVCDQHSGDCLFDCPQFPCSQDGGSQDAQASGNVAVIGGAVGCAVLIISIVAAVSVFIFIRKRRRKMLDPERKVTYDNSVNIEDDDTDDNVYSVPDKKRSVYENVNRTHSTASSTLPKLTSSKGPVTDGDVIYSNVGGITVTPSGLGCDEPEESFEEFVEDDVKNGDLKVADKPNTENYYNIYGLTRSRVQVDTLREHVDSISMEDFEKEFKKLPKGLTRPYADAVKATNALKNRYKGIYPYDSTRVKLAGNERDYINASYIQGYKGSEKTYIASSGPADKFMKGYVEFWEMVWQEKVDKIVMLTNFMEESKMKCEKYWPDVGEHKTYGDISVHCMSAERYADFTVTKLTIKKDSHVSSIHHFHFTAWPDLGTPEYVDSLVEFRETVEHVPKITEGPIVVHCSAGIGRTGTYIALDILTREGQSENYVDVYGCVLGLRGQRVLMVQNVEQYRFLHYALSHSLTNKYDQIASKEFCTVNTNEIREQFERLGTVHVLNGDEEKKAIENNGKEKYKNRKGASIPGDAHRPRLFKYNQKSKSDYINAIYIDGYNEKNRYIIAQTPLSKTVEDFLGLVMQENCSCIISLDPVEFISKQDIGDYLPDVNHNLTVGKINVSCVQRETTPEYILSNLNVSVQEVGTKETKTISHYQYTGWPEDSPVPSSTGSFLNLVQLSRQSVREPNMPLGPVIIHCLTGGDRSGLFTVVANIIEKINTEQQASIVNIVSQVRARRPRAIPNKEQFKFCYEIASRFVENNSVYSNIL